MQLYQVKCLVDDGSTRDMKNRFVFADNSIQACSYVEAYWNKQYDTTGKTISVISIPPEQGLIFDSVQGFIAPNKKK